MALPAIREDGGGDVSSPGITADGMWTLETPAPVAECFAGAVGERDVGGESLPQMLPPIRTSSPGSTDWTTTAVGDPSGAVVAVDPEGWINACSVVFPLRGAVSVTMLWK